jgi:DNA mismatch repair protein MutS2
MGNFTSAVQKLEFEKIIRRITQLAATEPGKIACSRLAPLTDTSAIRLELDRVTQMKELLIIEGSLPLDGLKDVAPPLKKSGIENHILTPAELLDVAAALRVSRTMAGFLSRRKEKIPALHPLDSSLFADKVVEFNIQDAIDETGRVRDSSSKELRLIRQDMTTIGEQLRKRLGALVRSIAEKDLLQEDIVTTRDGRFVIPVKSEYKHRVPGFIHSASASGATVFIEPAETLELNNSLRELQFREQREIERILRALTGQVAEIRVPIEESVKILGIIDCIAAKAHHSIEILGNAPKIAETPMIDLKDVRHPLLLQTHRRDSVVPLSLRLGRSVLSLLITGPNAGGKSVALKTVGLSVLCAQSGLHLPAGPDSELSVFEDVFVDIGDDQSVENDLSTFSSHLVNVKNLLDGAGPNSLVLIDEIGSGTDPSEGAALASAVLEELLRRKSLTIATTHHGMLKAFAHQTEGMANGSMEFDQETLSPTYRFRFGMPGSSYALELAGRIGLEKGLLGKAHAYLGSDKWKLESLIARLERDVSQYQEQLSALAIEKGRLDKLVAEYERRISDASTEVKELKRKATDEAKNLVAGAQAAIERVVKDIRETSAAKVSIQAAKKTLDGLRARAEEESPTELHHHQLVFKVGDRVHLKEGTETGEILELRGSTAVVLWKNGRIKIHIQDLRRTDTDISARESLTVATTAPNFRNELDLRGLTGEEAITQVQHFLDDALVSGLQRVDIIHGKGTGALRKRVTEFLKDYPHVKSYRLGEWNEGGSGVTVVELSD